MIINSSAQLHAFLLCLAVGLGLGFLYDLLRMLRLSLPLWLLRAMTDVLYWLCFLFALFLCAGMLGDGRIRLYMTLSLAGGASLYFLLPGPFVRLFLDTQRKTLTAQLAHFFILLKKYLKKTFSFFL